MSPARRRLFHEFDRAALLSATEAYRRALITASTAAPIGGPVHAAVGEMLNLMRPLGAALTGNELVFSGGGYGHAQPPTPLPMSPAELAEAADEVIAMCGGDPRAAVDALLLANEFYESEIARLADAVSPAYVRGRLMPWVR